MTENEIPRDRWGRPLIIPLDGGDPVAYTRASTLAKALDDQSGLMLWKQRKTAEGLVRRPDLLTRVSGAIANGDPDEDWPTKKNLNSIVNEALEAAGGTAGRNAGSGLHELTQAADRGDWPLWISPDDEKRLNAYVEATRRLTALDAETFVVVDDITTAGSFDRLWRLPDGRVVVGDLKTGKSEADYPLATTIQLAIYAHGRRYDPATGKRTRLHKDLDMNEGLLIHLPASGGCQVIPLDLRMGWKAAKLAAEVRAVRGWKPADLYVPVGGAA